ncbi:MAG: DUF484 family protein [Wenzhouxiangella sp.]|jgi:uncharacterized protein YigA (DUF484 family)|nr:DUF484 family protein [Wenzhouxiangella sp.]
MSDQPELNAQQVADWLQSNPDLLVRFPDLIDRLELPEPAQAVSLVQHKLLRLRKDNEELQNRLRQLTSIAGENERLMQQLHQLTLEAMSADTESAFVDCLLTRMADDFQADAVRLHLVTESGAKPQHQGVTLHGAERPEWLNDLIARKRPYCGRLTRKKLQDLFPNADPAIGSCVVVPLAGQGLLAVGAAREDYFHPDMGTVFLELIASTITWRLKLSEQDDRKRA